MSEGIDRDQDRRDRDHREHDVLHESLPPSVLLGAIRRGADRILPFREGRAQRSPASRVTSVTSESGPTTRPGGVGGHRWRPCTSVRSSRQKGGGEDDERRAREVSDRGSGPRRYVGTGCATAGSSPRRRTPGARTTAGWGDSGTVVIAVQALGTLASGPSGAGRSRSDRPAPLS